MKQGRWQRRHCHPKAPATHIPPWLDWLWFIPVLAYLTIICLWLYIVVPLFAVMTYHIQHWPVKGDTFLERLRNHVKEEVENRGPKWL